jgi:hypothetical protein
LRFSAFLPERRFSAADEYRGNEMPLNLAEAESIIEAGILGPSADNRHVLRFEIAANEIRVRGSHEFGAAPFHRRVLALISLGAVVENMVLRAASLGFSAQTSWALHSPRGVPLATLSLSSAKPAKGELEAAISRRHTNRRVVYRGPRLSDEQQRQITEESESVPGVRLLWLDVAKLRGQALRLVTLAESERFRSEPLHRELFSNIRFDVGWRATAADGLPPGALEIEPPMRPMFKALRHWNLMRPLCRLGVDRMIGFRAAYLPCMTAPHVCALATPLDLDRGAIAVGRALERVWLRATSLRLAFQPFAAAPLLALDGYRDVEERVRGRLATGWSRICPDALPLMVFRVGHAGLPSIRSGRPVVADFVDRPTSPAGSGHA